MIAPTATILFAGGGGVEAGFRAAGIDCRQRVEFDEHIAAVNELNFGPGVICAPVQSVDLSRLSPTDGLHASPPCQGASVARSKKLAAREDDGAGIVILDYVDALRPRWVTLENVPPYENRPVFTAILHGLTTRGYDVQWGIVNSADYGVPQTRRRLILRAVRKGERLLPLVPTHCQGGQADGLFGPGLLPWNGWYNAIHDLIPTLPNSAFADWQLKRLPAELFGSTLFSNHGSEDANGNRVLSAMAGVPPAMTVASNERSCRNYRALLVEIDGQNGRGPNKTALSVPDADAPAGTVRTNETGGTSAKAFLAHGTADNDRFPLKAGNDPAFTITNTNGVHKALLVDGQNARPEDVLTARRGQEPSFTIGNSAKGNARAWLEQGRVVAMTPRALARFQSIPDSMALPENKSLASKIIGNAVPPLLATAIARTLPGVTEANP